MAKLQIYVAKEALSVNKKTQNNNKQTKQNQPKFWMKCFAIFFLL